MSQLLNFSTHHVLRTEAQHAAAVSEIDALLDAEPAEGSEAYGRLEFLSVLVQAYEAQHHPMPPEDVSAQAIVDFVLEQKSLNRTALWEAMGGESRVSEFFSGEGVLSREQMEALQDVLGIPVNLLL